MNDVGWISGSSAARTCLMVGRNHGGEVGGACRYEGGCGTCCGGRGGRLNLTRGEGRH